MRKIILSILISFLFCGIANAQQYLWRYRTHATDCTSLTDGKSTDLCHQLSDDTFYTCVPTSGDCDTPSEWKKTAGKWGSISGTLNNQTDLQNALNSKADKTITVNGQAISSNVSITSITGNAGTATAFDHTPTHCNSGYYPNGIDSGGNAVNCSQINSAAWGGITGVLSSQTDLQTALNGKISSNSAISGATKTKITYDIKGLITSGTDAITADIADSTDKRYVTDAQRTVIANTSGTNTGDETTSTIKTKLGITTLSGSNTGDQDLSGYLTSSTASSTYQPLSNFPSSSVDNEIALFSGTGGKIVKRATGTGFVKAIAGVVSYDNSSYVQTSTTVNGHAMSSNVVVSASDITTGTLPAAQLPSPSSSTLGGTQSAAAVSHQWIDSISTSGVPHLSQPAYSDISGAPAAYWTLSSTNLYSPTSDTVTVGFDNNASYDSFTVNTNNTSNGGVSINSTASTSGIDSFTVAMLHMDGTNGSTTFTDSEITPKTFTANGSAQISTAQFEFGGASYLGGAITDWVETPTSSDWAFPGDFTVDCWVRLASASTLYYLGGTVDDNAGSAGWGLRFTAAGELELEYQYSGSFAVDIKAAHGQSANTWFHVAAVRNGSAVNLYVNGVSIANATNSTAITNTRVLRIGNLPTTGLNKGLSGNIDEFRVSKGIARWTSNFTPPTSPYAGQVASPGIRGLVGGVQSWKLWTDGSSSNQLTETVGTTNTATTTTTNKTLNTTLTLSTKNIITDTTTGTSFGTGTTQKTSAYGVTPVIQALATTDLGTVLSNWGLRAVGTAYPITTSGATNLSGSNTINGYATTGKAVSYLSYQPGLLTAVNPTIGVYAKVSNASTVDNLIASAVTFSCVANPTITMYECGTSSTCTSSPVTIGTITVTAAGTATVGTISNSAITAGDYIGWAMTAGTCASIDISANAQVHSN